MVGTAGTVQVLGLWVVRVMEPGGRRQRIAARGRFKTGGSQPEAVSMGLAVMLASKVAFRIFHSTTWLLMNQHDS